MQNDNGKSKIPREAGRRNFALCILNFEFKRERAAFTLLETIIALTLIISAVTGPFTLATRSIFSAKFAKDKLTALNLAGEGIELVRAMRENNVLHTFDWRGAGCGAGTTPYCTNLADGSYQPDVFTVANGSQPPLAGASPQLLRFDSVTGFYSQSSGSITLFTRVITISTPAANQMRVVSLVTWTQSGIDRQARLQEVFYNW